MSGEHSENPEHPQPGPGSTAQGGPRSVGDQGGTGPSSGRDETDERHEKERREDERHLREAHDEEGDAEPSEAAQAAAARSGAARSQ
jgi:hypothetical protein